MFTELGSESSPLKVPDQVGHTPSPGKAPSCFFMFVQSHLVCHFQRFVGFLRMPFCALYKLGAQAPIGQYLFASQLGECWEQSPSHARKNPTNQHLLSAG